MVGPVLRLGRRGFLVSRDSKGTLFWKGEGLPAKYDRIYVIYLKGETATNN